MFVTLIIGSGYGQDWDSPTLPWFEEQQDKNKIKYRTKKIGGANGYRRYSRRK